MMNEVYQEPSTRPVSRFLLESVPDPVFVFDEQGQLIDRNRAAEECSYTDVLGSVLPLGPKSPPAAFFDELCKHGGAVCEVEHAAEGRCYHLLIQGSRLDSSLVVTVRDLSQQKALADELKRFRRAESSSLLTARIIHDLNNLLMPILCLSRDLVAELPPPSPAAALAIDLESTAQRAASLVRDVLAFTRRRNRMNIESVNSIVAALRPLMELLTGPDVELVTLLDAQLEDVRIDRSELEHAILNLVANARHAMPDGGRVLLTTANCPSGQVVLTVADTGLGMTDEVRTRACDAFFTTRAETGGTGLGLSAVRSFASGSGGTFSLESEPGAGTRAILRIPHAERLGRAERSAEPDDDAGARATSSTRLRVSERRQRETILLVHRDGELRRELQATLQRRGFEVNVEASFEEASALLDASPRSADLVLMDMNLVPPAGGEAIGRSRRGALSHPVSWMRSSRRDARESLGSPGIDCACEDALIAAIRLLLDGNPRPSTTSGPLESTPRSARSR